MAGSISQTWTLALLCSALGCAGGGASPGYGESRGPVIYGQDDRQEEYAYPLGSRMVAWAESTAMMIDTRALAPAGMDALVPVLRETFAESMKASGMPLCPDERFRDEPDLGGTCSAFLVAPDTVMTAGHCVVDDDACADIAFVFGTGYAQMSSDPARMRREDVYFCAEVRAALAEEGRSDYAIVKLDRPVSGRAPLPLRREGKVADDEDLVLIGNPMGLPTKIAEHAEILDNAPPSFFKASTDSYHGNSGSAVLGVRSGLVEGMLLSGEDDFVRRGDCWVSRDCPEESPLCTGETVERAAYLAAHLE